MSASEIVLIDLSSIAYPIYMKSGAEPDVDFTSREIVARVRALTAAHPKAAICCDKGKSFRHELDPAYKANRPEKEAALHHQIALAVERLQADGYPVWAVKGFEADDLIASAVALAVKCESSALVVSADKDLLQLVGKFGENGERAVRVMSPATGTIYDREAVKAKFDVWPEQIRDYLCLVGDASDNVRGAQGIGPKKAAELLNRYGNLEAVYAALTEHGTQFKPAMATSLRDFEPRLAAVRQLITLRSDVEIPFAELDNERQAVDAGPMEALDMETAEERAEVLAAAPVVAEVVPEAKPVGVPPSSPLAVGAGQSGETITVTASAPKSNGNGKGLDIPATAAPVALMPFERQLEPQSLGQAARLAEHMHAARMFNGYGTPQAVLSTVLAGRELGLQAIASLRAFHVIEGKHALAADAMRGLVLRAGVAKYFRCVARTAEIATFETWRNGDSEPVTLSYTIAEARAAFVGDDAKWAKSGWGRHTADMLAARASSKLARLVYADILFGLYAPEELTEGAA